MKKNRLMFLLVAVTCLTLLSGCKSNDAENAAFVEEVDGGTTEDTTEKGKEETESEEMADNKDTKEVSEESTEGPVFSEDFEGESNIAIERGPVSFSITKDGADGSKALLISDRTDAWNGANFDANAFRGNKIRVNAKVKSAAKSIRLSIQYDVDGITAYNWITSTNTSLDSYAFVTGTYDAPADAENIFVYVESDTTDDIYVDDILIKAEGTYKKPAAVEEKVMADTSDYASLKELFADSFEIGVCINPAVITNEDYSKLVIKEFSSVTMENDLKPESILDKAASMEDLENGGTHLSINMEGARAELDFAAQNKMKVRGHTLIWHSQTPDWIFYVDYDTKGELASRELMLTRVDNYMNDVFRWTDENYPGLFYAWDIVNEAIEDNGKMRDSLWYQTIGEDYLEQVFAIARKYAPCDIKLFYNDYNSFQTAKQNGIIEALKPVAKAGNLDGIGMQGHLYTGEEPEHFVKAAGKYADELGVVIHITEIDVSSPSGNNPEGVQGKYYGNLFRELKKAKAEGIPIDSVSIWGLTDSLSWKASDKPLLFNGDLTGKQAFFEVVAAGKE